MSLRLLFFTGVLFWGWNATAQIDSLSTKYREDQFYISFGLQLQQENISGFKQNGFSNNFQVGFVRDIPLSASGRTAIGLGLGYAYNRLISNLHMDSQGENDFFFHRRKRRKPPDLFLSCCSSFIQISHLYTRQNRFLEGIWWTEIPT